MTSRTINVFLGNHPPIAQETLRDMYMAFAGMLGKLGQIVVASAELRPPPAINLIFEHFEPAFVERLRPLLPHIHLGLVCTEPFAGNPLSDPAYRRTRIDGMLQIGAQCRFVWCLDLASLAEFRQAFGAARVFPIPVGFVETLVDRISLPDSAKRWDICFTGSMTDYRAAMLDSLKRAGLSVIHGLFPHYMRQSIMECSRLQITLRQSETLSIPSQMRMSYCLANDYPIVSDLGDEAKQTPVEAYVTAGRRAEFVELCRAIIAGRADAAGMREAAARFRQDCRMDVLNAESVAASLAL